MSPSSAEYSVARNYIDWVLDLPWNELKDIHIDIKEAKTILDNAHFGLEKPKERILEYLAVQKLTDGLKGPILCLSVLPGLAKLPSQKALRKPPAGILCVFPWAASVMKLKFGGTEEHTSAQCPEKFLWLYERQSPITHYSAWMKSIK